MEVTFKHSGNAGDIVYAMSALQAYNDNNPGHYITLYLNLNVPAYYYKGANHPVKSGTVEVMLNKKMAEMITPLLTGQEYINKVEIYDQQKVIVDLDNIRRQDCGMPYLPIQKWYSYLFPDLHCDISKQWLYCTSPPGEADGKVIINRTSRYTNRWTDFRFLREYPQSSMLFVGLEDECQKFNTEFGLSIEHYPVRDFDELMNVIDASAFFVGNQSMAFGLAEGLKIPRILETCDFAPNVIPVGKDAYDFLYTDGLKYHFANLYRRYGE
jgi:hypothetical protein